MHTAAISKVTITLAHFQKNTYNTNWWKKYKEISLRNTTGASYNAFEM